MSEDGGVLAVALALPSHSRTPNDHVNAFSRRSFSFGPCIYLFSDNGTGSKQNRSFWLIEPSWITHNAGQVKLTTHRPLFEAWSLPRFSQ